MEKVHEILSPEVVKMIELKESEVRHCEMLQETVHVFDMDVGEDKRTHGWPINRNDVQFAREPPIDPRTGIVNSKSFEFWRFSDKLAEASQIRIEMWRNGAEVEISEAPNMRVVPIKVEGGESERLQFVAPSTSKERVRVAIVIGLEVKMICFWIGVFESGGVSTIEEKAMELESLDIENSASPCGL
jgi:hypothetical protein